MTTKRKRKSPEADFQKKIVERARELGWKVHPHPHYRKFQGKETDAGFPDLFLWKGPWVLAFEVKGPRTSIDHDQRECIGSMRENFVALIVRPKHWSIVEDYLENGPPPTLPQEDSPGLTRDQRDALIAKIPCSVCNVPIGYTGAARIDGEWKHVAKDDCVRPVPCQASTS